VIDNSLLSADLANNKAVGSADVKDGSLNDDDVGQGAFIDFPTFHRHRPVARVHRLAGHRDRRAFRPPAADDGVV
jgi:hypothetical protein